MMGLEGLGLDYDGAVTRPMPRSVLDDVVDNDPVSVPHGHRVRGHKDPPGKEKGSLSVSTRGLFLPTNYVYFFHKSLLNLFRSKNVRA